MLTARQDPWKRNVLPTPDDHRDILQHNRNTDRGNQRRQSRRVTQGPISDALDRETQQHASRHRHQHPTQYDQDARGIRRNLHERADDRQSDHRAHHRNFAMGKIDQLENAVDHCVAECNERVDAAQHQTVDQLLQKNIHATAPRYRALVAPGSHRLQHLPLATAHLIQRDIAAGQITLAIELNPPGHAPEIGLCEFGQNLGRFG